MLKPSLQAYDLSESDLASVVRLEKRLTVPVSIVGALVGAAFGFLAVGFTYQSLVGGIIAAIVFACGAGFLFAPSWAVSLSRRIDPRAKRYAQFRSDLTKYESWELRTRMEFWRSLPGHRFEHELGALFRRHGYLVQVTPGSGDARH